MGSHLWDVAPDQFRQFHLVSIYLVSTLPRQRGHWRRATWALTAAKVGIAPNVVYNFATIFIKASILFFYLRFAATNRPFRVVVYIVLAVVIAYSLLAATVALWSCRPTRKFWDPSVTEGECVDGYLPYLTWAVLNSVTDVVILLLPLWLVRPLRVPWRRKVGVGLVLMTGGL